MEELFLKHEKEGLCDVRKEITEAVNEVAKTWESKKEELKDEVKDELQTVLTNGKETQEGLAQSEVREEVKVALEVERDKEYRATVIKI